MPKDFEEMARRRGFFWQSSEIYGGLAGFYDYGHLGTLVKKKWENLWRNYFLGLNGNFFEIEPTNIMHEKVFVASGHVQNFVDPVAKCRKCGHAERADHILEDVLHESFEGVTAEELSKLIKKHNVKCSKCGGQLEDASVFNMLLPVELGVESRQKAYLRGETAQGVYVNFLRAFDQTRKKLPLGLAIVGRAYRNEVSPRNLLLRMREFTQAELQIFFDPDKINEHEDFESVASYKLILLPVKKKLVDMNTPIKNMPDNSSNVETKKDSTDKPKKLSCKDAVKIAGLPKFYLYHMAKVQQFYLDVIKVPEDRFRFRELGEEERAFYNKYHWDIELKLEEGWKECGGVHYRTDHDLGGHQKISKKDMSVNIEGKKFIPHVLELSFGVDRNIYALMESAYVEEKERTVLKFPRVLSPFDCAVFPLVNKEGLPEKAMEIKKALSEAGLNVFHDESGSIGRRYRRMDEIGTAVCITVDGDTLKNGSVTLRDRDSMQQIRLPAKKLAAAVKEFLNGNDLKELA